ncbi:MAG: aminotransferase class I/II-fold pyridoxal phosphate-dependent enzyme [Oligoflexales bacterium]|nr:aminotransferase class I/II-fold pyridoxal phosphate-dependent enzyme [Oligoflexales bacterium]
MSSTALLNSRTESLAPYPMEELARIKRELLATGQKVYNFGTGDPTIPVWEPITEAIKDGVSTLSQYPSIHGLPELREAHKSYLKRRFGIETGEDIMILPTRGSKEAVFHIALSLVGRAGGRKRIVYPDPGYPVYRSSAIFAGGTPHPVQLKEEESYLLKPWQLDKEVVKDTAALWLNYPHNPTGAIADKSYWQELINWAHDNDVIILSDDCYADIYDDSSEPPLNPLSISSDRVLSFMSLSKRSGLTGFRAGFLAGDSKILKPHSKARANFGLANPVHIQEGSIVAWNDDAHVKERRVIFGKRMEALVPFLMERGVLKEKPKATFYLWCKVPKKFNENDIEFCLQLAKKGIIASPSSWLSENVSGYFRLALVPSVDEIQEAKAILKDFLS